MLIMGVLSTAGTAVMQPLNMQIFGDLLDNIIKFATILATSTDPNVLQEASDKFMDDIREFAVYNTLIGVGTLVTSYLATVLFNYTSLRQVCLYNLNNSSANCNACIFYSRCIELENCTLRKP